MMRGITQYLEKSSNTKNQTIIETVQAQGNKLTYCDSQVFGMHVVLEW